MKTLSKASCLILAAWIAVALPSCTTDEIVFSDGDDTSSEALEEDTEEETLDETVNNETTVSISIDVTDTGVSVDDCTLHTMMDEVAVSELSGGIKSVYNNLPQVYYVTNSSGDILLMTKACISQNDEVVIDEETTALALAALNPAFVNVTRDNYDTLTSYIKSASSYDTYLSLVKEAIASGRDIFDTDNTDLLVALSTVSDEVVTAITDDYESRSVSSRAAISRSSNIEGIDVDPLSVIADGVDLIVRNKGLIPTYECTVSYAGEVIETRMIESHSSYGGMDLFQLLRGCDIVYGDPETFCLCDEGEYRFNFDRTTEEAMTNYSRRLWADVLTMVGLYSDSNLLNNSVGAIAAIATLLANPDTSWDDVVSTAVGYIITATAGSISWKKAAEVISKVCVSYNLFKGFSNEMTRIVLGFTTPFYVDFCVCQYDCDLSSCTEAELFIESGDGQEGYSGQELLLPLTVSTVFYADDGSVLERSTYQKVKFEVTSGGGYVSEEIVGTEADSQTASTYWTLGDEGEQEVRAVIIDLVTGDEVCEPVYFTATLLDDVDITIRLDWNKLSGNTDIDLHVTDPYGEEIAYYNMTSSSGGWLDRDDVVGPGPEHICWTDAPEGDYLVQVHYYYSETQEITSFSVTLNVLGNTFGPYTGSIAYHQLITIGTLSIPDCTFSRSAGSSSGFYKMYEVKDDVIYEPKDKASSLAGIAE